MHRPALRRMLALGLSAAAVVTAGTAVTTVTTVAAAPAATAATCPAPAGASVAAASVPTGDVKIFGHGWGHGMGMSQYGAQGAARLGCSYRTILDTYYANTRLDTRALNARVVLTLAAGSTKGAVVATGGPVRWRTPAGAVQQPAGSTWTVVPRTDAGRAGVAALDATGRARLFAAAGTYLSAKHSGTQVTVRATTTKSLVTRYDTARFLRSGRGMEVTELIGPTGRTPAVQKYLMGLGEVPLSWPVEALKAQVVAARTYLTAKYDATLGAYRLSTTTADQVYRGYLTESADARLGGGWRAAVLATQGEVIVDRASGRAIEAMYSSSMGGYTENRQYVYGRYGISYLKAVDDSRWDNASDNPYRSWSRGFSKAEFAKKLGLDTVSTWTIGGRGSSARVDAGLVVTGTVDGAQVTRTFTGSAARTKLGLRSPGFTFKR
jgi:stage II sporulation protein D